MKSILRKISEIENHSKSIGPRSLRTTNKMQHLKYICSQYPRAMVYSCGFSAMFLKGKISFALQVLGSNTIAICVLVFAKDFDRNGEISEHEWRLWLVNFFFCISCKFLFISSFYRCIGLIIWNLLYFIWQILLRRHQFLNCIKLFLCRYIKWKLYLYSVPVKFQSYENPSRIVLKLDTVFISKVCFLVCKLVYV